MYPLASGFGTAYCRSPLPQVARQKSLREGERSEFTDAKERVKASWAADREDFARVKESLKKKNAEHHLQCGRLSQVCPLAECARCAPCLRVPRDRLVHGAQGWSAPRLAPGPRDNPMTTLAIVPFTFNLRQDGLVLIRSVTLLLLHPY